MALGSDVLGTLVSVAARPIPSRADRWEVSGLAWNERLHFRADARQGYVAIRNLRVSPALGALPEPYRSPLEAELLQLNDVLPGMPQAYVSP